MENIFYAGALCPIFDLKGSERARLARDDPGDPARVLLDQNLVQRNLGSPILVHTAFHAEDATLQVNGCGYVPAA